MAGGRPLKFNSPEELDKKVCKYFKSLFKPSYYKVPSKDLDGKNIPGVYDFEPKLDHNNKHLKEFTETPTITGLAVYLDTSRETLIDYQNKDEFSDTVRKAKEMIEYYTENDPNTAPVLKIFKLKNFDWKDKIVVNEEPEEDIEEINERLDNLFKKLGS